MAKDPKTKPDMAPLDIASSNVDMCDAKSKRFQTDETVYINTTKTLRYFAETLKAAGVKPMQELWNISSIRTTQAFVEMGLFQEPLYMEIGLTEGGILAGHPGTVKGLEAFLDFLPHNCATSGQWSVTAATYCRSSAQLSNVADISPSGLGIITIGRWKCPPMPSSSHGWCAWPRIWDDRLPRLRKHAEHSGLSDGCKRRCSAKCEDNSHHVNTSSKR